MLKMQSQSWIWAIWVLFRVGGGGRQPAALPALGQHRRDGGQETRRKCAPSVVWSLAVVCRIVHHNRTYTAYLHARSGTRRRSEQPQTEVVCSGSRRPRNTTMRLVTILCSGCREAAGGGRAAGSGHARRR